MNQIDGVALLELTPRVDERGHLVEVFRTAWIPGVTPVQWNFVKSIAGTLRGVHCHIVHTDYLTVLEGHMLVGLHDLRPDSPTQNSSMMIDLTEATSAVVIPPGVAHGFYFQDSARYLYGVTTEWNPADELGCRFDDPELGLAWPTATPLMSARDQEAGSLSDLRTSVQAALAAVGS
ncbi:MAG: dTDP-4-dehydrorhamnose 3,5-epimerase family protein [Actinobacteria bacterium]|nr:dTDP-4-dehydrorhamnose 3,5-epimerase family protein [Actinomycetota bacterium]